MKNPFARFRRTTPQTYIVPTRFGFIFFIVFILMVMVGATYQNNMVFIMAFLLFSLAIIAMIQTHHNLDGLVIENVLVDSGFANGTGRIQVRAQSAKKRAFISTVFEGKNVRAFADIVEADKKNFIDGFVQYGPRGVYTINRIKVKTVFPYGLFVAWQYHKVNAEFHVYPERLGDLTLPKKSTIEGEDFSGHKKFSDKDSLRHVDWKAYARGRPLLLKEFKDGADVTYLFDIDQVKKDDVEQKLSQLSKWISETYAERKYFGLILGRKIVPPSNSAEQFHRCLRELAKYVA
jgi:uncharacterized protein (DUF58 family)